MALTRFRSHQLGDFDFKESVRVATTTNVTLSGGAPNSVDGINLALNDRILVWQQSTGSQNGIYVVQTLGTGSNGTWVRSVDTNTSSKVTAGLTVRTEEGTLYGARGFRLTTPNPITLGSTSLTFTLDGGAAVAGGAYTTVQYNDSGTIQGDSNLTWNGSTLSSLLFKSTQSSGNEGGQIDLAAPAANTTITTGVSIDVYQDRLRIFETGGTNRGAFIDISNLASGINLDLATSLVNGNSNVKVVANSNVTISSTGTANVLVVTGTGANIAGTANVTGAVALGSTLTVTGVTNLGAVGNVRITGGSNGQYLQTNGSAGLSWATISTIANGTSNISIPSSGGNINLSTGGTANVLTVTSTGANIAGTLHVTGVSNLGAVGNLVLTGGVNGQVIKTDGSGNLSFYNPPSGVTFAASASSPALPLAGDQWYDTGTDTLYTRIDDGTSAFWLDISSQPNSFDSLLVANNTTTATLTVNTNITVGNISASGVIAGNLSTAAQPNVTSLGTLTGLTTNGAISIQYDGTADTGTVNNDAMFEIKDTGATSRPSMVFHRPSAWATKIVLDTDNKLYFGGWSAAAGGQAIVCGNITPGANVTYNLGATSLRWSTIYGTSTSAQYADLAELYECDAEYENGSVVILAGSKEVTVTAFSHDTRVLGVLSTAPAFLMNDGGQDGIWKPVAMTGRVPCKVKGPVARGDLLVASSVVGAAERLDKSKYEHGCILGKSMEDHPGDDVKMIEAVIGRF